MQYTTNYSLKKPGYGDIVDPKDYNDNFNTIDSTLKSVSDAAAGNAYSAMTQVEANAGTATTARTITAKVLKDTISSKAWGGFVYYLIEVAWRGFSHPSMFAVGGFCFVLLDVINIFLPWTLGLVWQSIIGAGIVTAAENVMCRLRPMWHG